ncbi:MAG: M43 family zinc metalloprotease [Bacteroidota bacterium]
MNEDYKTTERRCSKYTRRISSRSIKYRYTVCSCEAGSGWSSNQRHHANTRNQNSYTTTNDVELKSLSYWPAEDYLNIWVTNLGGGFLGYAHFPITTLQGTDPPYDAATDGVVIHYKAFGSSADGSFSLLPQYNLGRTATHEVGHYLGLLHVFGDFSGCGTTDYVDDTPVQSDRTFTCPTGPLTQCTHHVMYQNFLDYTDDACMNLFTRGSDCENSNGVGK